MDDDASGSTPLFAVFILSLASLVLIPYTLYQLFGGEADEKEVRTAEWCPVRPDGRGCSLLSTKDVL